jgi:two-component system, OmpR family, response regulator
MARILLVEDEIPLARTLTRGMQERGHQVEVAHDGHTGYRLAKDGSFDVIVFDVMLPGISGLEACRRLRAAQVGTPILVLTARILESDETDALDMGADDYLRKPFSFRVLVARVHALLRRAALGDPPPLAAGDLRLDLPARRVFCGEEEVSLSAREFDLLAHLVRRAGRVVSKRDILAGVWDDDFTGDPNVVEVYVARLRRKLDGTSGRAGIETIRGVGYRVPRA